MTNPEIVKLLRSVAAALTIKGENRFRIIAYEKAADSIEHLTSEVKDIWEEGKLESISGVGAAISSSLDELFKTGNVKHFEAIFSGISPAFFEFLLIPGVGPKKAYQLTKELRLNDPKIAISRLEKAAKTGKIATLPGWGEKSQTEILSAIETYRKGQIKENRMVLPYADSLAQEIVDYLKKVPGVIRVDKLGSLRRKVATIGDIDLAVATDEPQAVLEAFIHYPKVRKIIDQGPKGATVFLSVGKQVDLRVQTPKAYGAMLQYFTGGKNHNIRLREYALKHGFSLNEYGIKNVKTGKTKQYGSEEDFYQALKMDWIPPEIREDAGEIEVSLQHKLPALVKMEDIKGDLHIHSNYDLKPSHDLGASNLEELLDTAVELGYEYIGISDHNPSVTNQTERQIIDIMKRRRERFEYIYNSWSQRVKKPFDKTQDKRVQICIMLEVDIDPKGKLALPESAFEYVDGIIISVHSSFNLSKEQMTERILSAFSHPKAKILGHPTGRLFGQREGYEVDWTQLFAFCKEYDKALEINSWPERLDLPDLLVRDAVRQGVKLVINTDSHAAVHLNGIQYGVDVARRGWAEKKDVLNTMGYNDFSKWLKS